MLEGIPIRRPNPIFNPISINLWETFGQGSQSETESSATMKSADSSPGTCRKFSGGK